MASGEVEYAGECYCCWVEWVYGGDFLFPDCATCYEGECKPSPSFVPPDNEGVECTNGLCLQMNYAIVVFLFVLMFAGGFWFTHGRHSYRGPRTLTQATQTRYELAILGGV